MRIKSNSAQQVIEYLLLAAGVIAGIVLFFRPGGVFRGAVEQTLNRSFEEVNRTADTMPLTPGDLGLTACPDPAYCALGPAACASCPQCWPCCGDGFCDPGEAPGCVADCTECRPNPGRDYCANPDNCADCDFCSPCCGDGVCDPGETKESCPEDGDLCDIKCGDPEFDCSDPKNCADCPDCSPCCGDGICNEDPLSCLPAVAPDCPIVCGHPWYCQPITKEKCSLCANCWPCCGNGKPEPEDGGCCGCPDDWGMCSCGNGECDNCPTQSYIETRAGFPAGTVECSPDCGSTCDDGVCKHEWGENCAYCASTLGCTGDCGWCLWKINDTLLENIVGDIDEFGWTECDRPCGGGKQRRKVTCVLETDQTTLAPEYTCDPRTKPLDERSCNEEIDCCGFSDPAIPWLQQCEFWTDEECDGDNLCGKTTCKTFDARYSDNGFLACGPDCKLDTSNCCWDKVAIQCYLNDEYFFDSCDLPTEINRDCGEAVEVSMICEVDPVTSTWNEVQLTVTQGCDEDLDSCFAIEDRLPIKDCGEPVDGRVTACTGDVATFTRQNVSCLDGSCVYTPTLVTMNCNIYDTSSASYCISNYSGGQDAYVKTKTDGYCVVGAAGCSKKTIDESVQLCGLPSVTYPGCVMNSTCQFTIVNHCVEPGGCQSFKSWTGCSPCANGCNAATGLCNP